jgi:hypothetical protein
MWRSGLVWVVDLVLSILAQINAVPVGSLTYVLAELRASTTVHGDGYASHKLGGAELEVEHNGLGLLSSLLFSSDLLSMTRSKRS